MHTKQKILQLSKERITVFGFAIFFNILLAGSVCGTFAWYTYATRTGFEKEYHGTTVGDLGSLQAGIVSNVQLENFVDYELAEDSTTLADEGKYIYWCRPVIKATTINYVISNNGSSTTQIDTVTSANYDMEGDASNFHLYRRPTHGANYSISEDCYANPLDCIYIPFVFRYEDIDNPGHYTSGQDIFFSECDIELDETSKDCYYGTRFFLSDKTKGYIVAPFYEEDGNNAVGGILDLDNDTYYDYDKETNHEIIYGQSQFYEYSNEPLEADQVMPEEFRDSFHASHKEGIYALNEETYVPESVSYLTLDHFLNRSIAPTTTNENYHNLGCLDFYMYLEGWDLHVINKEEGAKFNMEIAFSVSL